MAVTHGSSTRPTSAYTGPAHTRLGLPTFQAGDTRPPRWDMISAESSESRPSRCVVASRALTRRPRPRAGSYEEDGGGAGYDVRARTGGAGSPCN